MYNSVDGSKDDDDNPLSPSFKQTNGSFFQKQKVHSNRVTITPTKQRLIRASSITNILDPSHLKDIDNIANKPAITMNQIDNLDDNEEINKRLHWSKVGEAVEVH